MSSHLMGKAEAWSRVSVNRTDFQNLLASYHCTSTSAPSFFPDSSNISNPNLLSSKIAQKKQNKNIDKIRMDQERREKLWLPALVISDPTNCIVQTLIGLKSFLKLLCENISFGCLFLVNCLWPI